jgi:hypothetical protein
MRAIQGVLRGGAFAVVLGVLAACAGTPEPVVYGTEGQPISCVPYARAISGIALRGDAWTWWSSAQGRYARGQEPREGAVLVLARTNRLSHGHLSVVREIVSAREIVVRHANWASDPSERGRIDENMHVVDVSARNTWQLVRFWNDGAGAYGQPYPAYGFIYDRPPDQAALGEPAS